MKKGILTVALILAIFSELPAQQVEVGIKGGYLNTKFVGDSDPVFNALSNTIGGVTFSFWVNHNVTVEAEVLYARKGSETRTGIDFFNEGTEVLTDVSFGVNYIEVPVLGRWSLDPAKLISPTVHGGGYLGSLADSFVTYQAVSGGLSQRESDDSIKTLDYGVLAGVGVDLNIDFHTLRLDARYSRGLANLIDNNNDPKYTGQWTLTLGFEY